MGTVKVMTYKWRWLYKYITYFLVLLFKIGDIQPGSYKLIVQGNGGTNFQSSSPLKYIQKSYSVFIQTDKAVYKPGTKILFRTLVLNPELKPAIDVKTKPLNIHVSVSTYYSAFVNRLQRNFVIY